MFTDLAEAYITLLDHPAQTDPADLDDKLAYVYKYFLPLLKDKLREDAITQHIAALIGLSEEATALLIAAEINDLFTDVSTESFSATYFSDAAWTTSALDRTDGTIDFSWDGSSPDPVVPTDNFSARWQAYLAVPATGTYTLRVEVEEADEAFKLILDDVQILQKAAGNALTSWEIEADSIQHRCTG